MAGVGQNQPRQDGERKFTLNYIKDNIVINRYFAA
jgi:hypothetical protein